MLLVFFNYLQKIFRGGREWKLFVLKLLPHCTALDVIEDIQCNGGSKADRTSRIGKALIRQKTGPGLALINYIIVRL